MVRAGEYAENRVREVRGLVPGISCFGRKDALRSNCGTGRRKIKQPKAVISPVIAYTDE